MHQVDVLRLSKDAGISTRNIMNGDGETIYMEHLTRFAELVAQHESEACAKLADEFITGESRDGEHFYDIYKTGLSKAIRARNKS